MARMRGFSLIELIVVIMVMAILAAYAAPRFFGQGQFEAPAFAHELAAAARYAQKLAVVSGCQVNLSVSASGYSLLQPQATTPPCSGTPTMTLAVKHPATGDSYTGSVPSGVTIGGTLGTVNFSASGAPNGAASYAIGGIAVTIAAGSGYVEVQ
ncbi:MAG: pilus assembly FimT family protein [Gammaproteobacteria bacterium]